MTNENILHNIKCPKCGHTEDFLIVLPVQLHLTDDGIEIDEHADLTWDDEDFLECLGCRHEGPVPTFKDKK